jgi:hypothetical protein
MGDLEAGVCIEGLGDVVLGKSVNVVRHAIWDAERGWVDVLGLHIMDHVA